MAQKFTVPITVKQLSSAGSDALTVYVDADTYARLKVEAGGRLTWGAGASAGDVNLYRDSADVLRTDDTFKTPALFVDNIEIDPTGATTDQVLKYNGTKFVPGTGGNAGATLTVSDSKPTEGLAEGDLWFESDTGKTFVYYDSFWVEIGEAMYGGPSLGVGVNFLEFPSDIIPQTTNTYTLGSPTHKWQEVYVGPGSLYIEDAITGNNIEFTVSNGEFRVNGSPISTSIGANSVTLGTHTVGNYMSEVTAGTGITVTHTPGEGSNATITNAGVTSVNGSTGAITGVVRTSDTGTVTSTMIADGTIVNADISTTAAVALSKLASGTSGQVIVVNASGVPTYTTLSGDVTISNTGVVSIEANSVALGTDTTGNYMSGVSAGTGISVTHTPSEGSTATIALNANLDNLTDVTVASVADKQLLVYDSATSQWKNADAIVSSGIAYKSGFPASKTSTGTLGQICIDGANGTMYVCTGTNVWQKISLNSANFTNAGGFA